MPSDLQVQYEKEINSPSTDCLTGLYNHGFFHIALDWEIARSEQHGTAFSLAFLDIDHFSDYNKLHGYPKGDRMLKEVAAVIKARVRPADLAARVRGDQFVVTMPGCPLEEAVSLTEGIRQTVFKMSGGRISLSAGLASFPDSACNKEELIRKTLKALHHAQIDALHKVAVCRDDGAVANGSKASVLLVDDEVHNVEIMEDLLRPLNYEVFKAGSGEEALRIIAKFNVDLVLLDVMMPGIDGYEVCRRLKGSEATRMIPVILVTALDEMEAKLKSIEAGADDFLVKPPNRAELLARTKSLIRGKRMNDKLTSVENVLTSLANVVEAKDSYTENHLQRVARTAQALGRKLKLSDHELEALKLGGILHDIGKIAIPSDILNKPGPLSPEEWQLMMTHTSVGYNVCLPLKKTLGPALEIIRCHHEKLDGSGYPDGLAGEEIAMVARIMSVVDIYDALISDRPYREALSREEALALLHEKAAEGLLDAEVVNILTDMVTNDPDVCL